MRPIRSPLTSLAVLLLLLCTANGLRAQTAAAASAPVSDRASRDAHNPMRVILEAGRLKVRAKPDNDAPAAVAPRKDPAPTAAKAKPAAPAAAPAPATATAKAEAAAPSSAPEPTPAAAAPPAPAPETRTVLAAPTAAPAPAPAPARPVAMLKNIRLVEPELSASVLRRLRGEVEVVVGFTVNPDGSVSDVSIFSSPNKLLDSAVVDAVRQWRYEPVEQPRLHTVQLVLRGER